MEETETYADPLGLAVDLNEVSTLRPLLKDGNYAATIEAKIEQNSAKTGNNLVVGYKLMSPVEMQDGKKFDAGYTVTKWMPLQQGETALDKWDFKTDIVRVIDAALKTKQGTRPPIKSWGEVPGLISGHEVVITVKAKKDKKTDEISSEIVRVQPAAA